MALQVLTPAATQETSQFVPKNPSNAAKPTKIQLASIHPTRDTVQFGLQKADAPAASREKLSKEELKLLNREQPVFLLHGTSHRGEVMEQWQKFLQDAGLEGPVYTACLPEIEKATGIEAPKNPKKTMPAYLALLRDLGEFRLQLIDRQIQNLKKLKNAKDEEVARWFQIRPQDADWLVPIIRTHVLAPVTQVPEGWHSAYSQPLRVMVRKGVSQIRREAERLDGHFNTDEERAIIDSEYLYSQGMQEGRLSVDGKKPRQANCINPRPVDLQKICRVEGYLLAMRQKLAQALQAHWQEAKSPLSPQERQNLAEKTAQQIIDVIAPRVSLVGHSQGGTVILTALLNALQDPDKLNDMASQDPSKLSILPAQGIRNALLLSAPLNGIPEIPSWGQPLLETVEGAASRIPGLKEETAASTAKNLIWRAKASDRPAVLEMRAGSPLTQKLSRQLNSLEQWNGTVISAFDAKDGYVEPDASRLKTPEGQEPENFFNLELQNPMIPAIPMSPEEALERVCRKIPKLGGLALKMAPERLRVFLRDFYEQTMVGNGNGPNVEQHRALLQFPANVTRQVEAQLFEDERNLIRVLDVHNDDGLRQNALKTLLLRLRAEKQLPRQPLREELLKKASPLRKAILENAREDLPLTNSASALAQEVLNEIET
jgi:pimeloyl-ACP methyl ester carboxylesterase